MLFCKQYGLIENGFCDGQIELAMKFNEDGVLFLLNHSVKLAEFFH